MFDVQIQIAVKFWTLGKNEYLCIAHTAMKQPVYKISHYNDCLCTIYTLKKLREKVRVF